MKNLRNLIKPKTKNTKEEIGKSLKNNLNNIKSILNNNSDLIIREFKISDNYSCALIIIDGLTSGDYIYDYLLKTLMIDIRTTNLLNNISTVNELFNNILDYMITLIDIKVSIYLEDLLDYLLAGNSILIIDGMAKYFVIETKGFTDRGVVEATSQTVVRGPKDSFNETLRTNTMLIRRRIKDKNLCVTERKIGTITKTNIAILYIKGIAKKTIVDEVHKRLDKINIDGVLDSSYIEQLIQDHRYSVFPTIHNTERPDSAAGALLSGYVAIIVDGSPYVLIVPCLFLTLLQTSEDYYHRFHFGTFIRIIRFIAMFLTLLTPAIYIAITTFHQEMLPTPLLINISCQREGVPFPAFVEALLMEITFEILREAGVRMPRAIGSAVSIVGALVLGESAVQAGIVSAVMVIVVSITAISSLIAPTYNLGITVRLYRFFFILLAASLGMFGITIGLMILGLKLTSMKSFGVPYLYPLSPTNKEGLKDSIVRFPLWTIKKRPNLISDYNETRQEKSSKKKKKNRR
jgi:spore germination protein KA